MSFQDQLCLQMFKIMMEKWEENDMVIPMVEFIIKIPLIVPLIFY